MLGSKRQLRVAAMPAVGGLAPRPLGPVHQQQKQGKSLDQGHYHQAELQLRRQTTSWLQRRRAGRQRRQQK